MPTAGLRVVVGLRVVAPAVDRAVVHRVLVLRVLVADLVVDRVVLRAQTPIVATSCSFSDQGWGRSPQQSRGGSSQ